MVYEVLVALWHGPGNDLDVARSIHDRTGETFSSEAAGRYLRMLQANGYVDDDRHPLWPRYSINEHGSALLAMLTREVAANEVITA